MLSVLNNRSSFLEDYICHQNLITKDSHLGRIKLIVQSFESLLSPIVLSPTIKNLSIQASQQNLARAFNDFQQNLAGKFEWIGSRQWHIVRISYDRISSKTNCPQLKEMTTVSFDGAALAQIPQATIISWHNPANHSSSCIYNSFEFSCYIHLLKPLQY